MDPKQEMAAIKKIITLLENMEDEQANRVLSYVVNHQGPRNVKLAKQRAEEAKEVKG